MTEVPTGKLPVRDNLPPLVLLLFSLNPLKGLTKPQSREDSDGSQKAFDKVWHKRLLRNLAIQG